MDNTVARINSCTLTPLPKRWLTATATTNMGEAAKGAQEREEAKATAKEEKEDSVAKEAKEGGIATTAKPPLMTQKPASCCTLISNA